MVGGVFPHSFFFENFFVGGEITIVDDGGLFF
jgi:hypothetical protein